MGKPRTIVFLGKSGSGKDTQAGFVAEKLNPSLIVSTGDLGRKLMENSTMMGKRVKDTLEGGDLFPDWLASYLWEDFLANNFNGNENLVFPSSPRRLEEAKELDAVMSWLRGDKVEAVLVDIPDDEAIKRLLKRGRFDDTEENIRKRLDWFEENVNPTVDYYEKEGRLHRINGVGTVEEIAKHVDEALKIND